MTDFHSLYQQYAPQVHRFALFLCGDAALAEDITSETFVRVWVGRGKIREATVKAYLFTIARNLYHDSLRQKARHTELQDSIPDTQASPLAQAETRSELQVVLAAVKQLSEIDRAALLMRVQEEMSYEEIGQALNLAPATVKVKVHRARLKLMQAREALQEVHHES